MTGEPPNPPYAPVRRDVYCVTCGYDLRGQPMSGLCPECGTPVWRSPARVAPAPSRGFDRLLFLYAAVTGVSLLTLFFVLSSRRSRWNSNYRLVEQFFAWRAGVTVGLILLGLVWLAASRHARQSLFLGVLMLVNFVSLCACVPTLSR
jgi:hypothetical protein